MKHKFDLRIGDGIGPFEFGMTQAEVMSIYGVPSKRDIGRDYEFMYYHGDDLQLHFYGERIQILTHIDFYLKENIYYKEEQIRGKPKSYLLNSLFSDIQNWEITDDEGDYEGYFYREKWLSLVFVDNKLDSISLGRPEEKSKTLLSKLQSWLLGNYI